MNETSLIKENSFMNKIKRKFYDFIHKFMKKRKIDETITEENVNSNLKNKQEILELYNKIKNNQINLNILTDDQLSIFVKIANEEIEILKKKYDEEVTRQNICRREIRYYQEQLMKSQGIND